MRKDRKKAKKVEKQRRPAPCEEFELVWIALAPARTFFKQRKPKRGE